MIWGWSRRQAFLHRLGGNVGWRGRTVSPSRRWLYVVRKRRNVAENKRCDDASCGFVNHGGCDAWRGVTDCFKEAVKRRTLPKRDTPFGAFEAKGGWIGEYACPAYSNCRRQRRIVAKLGRAYGVDDGPCRRGWRTVNRGRGVSTPGRTASGPASQTMSKRWPGWEAVSAMPGQAREDAWALAATHHP